MILFQRLNSFTKSIKDREIGQKKAEAWQQFKVDPYILLVIKSRCLCSGNLRLLHLLYIYFACLSVCLGVCLYPKNVTTAEPVHRAQILCGT